MKVEIKCPSCNRKHDIDDHLLGQTLTCECGRKFVAQLPPSKVEQQTVEDPPATSLPVVVEEVKINRRIQVAFWIVVAGLVLLFVAWWAAGRPFLRPANPPTVSPMSVRNQAQPVAE